ncbi:MAG: class I SAM-dependent methyltransferase [Candidatus Omnitrophica bacterium]|nr:class I SAM-dependent methyltransferase [Candidatus Omnitrophota bacterium]
MSVFNKYMQTSQGKLFADKYCNVTPGENVSCILCGSPQAKEWYRMGDFISKICRRCGCRYVSPRFNDAQLDAHYSEDLFTKSKDYEGVRHNMLDENERARKRSDMKEEIRTTIERCPDGGKVLDIGCQTGIYLQALPASIEKYGIERSRWAAEHTRKITGAGIRTGKVEDGYFEQGFFDVINMSYVVEHLQHPPVIIKKIVSWLKPQGTLIISVPNFDSFCAKVFREFYRLVEPRQHLFLTTPASLRYLLDQMGVKIEKIYYPYFGTSYCRFSEQFRLLTNMIRRICLPVLLKINKVPEIPRLISPAFYGNIMTVIARKR